MALGGIGIFDPDGLTARIVLRTESLRDPAEDRGTSYGR